MNKLLVHLILVVSSVVLISGCTSGGTETVEEESDAFYDPLPDGSPVFAEIVEPYFSVSSTNENAISLYSYKSPESASELATEAQPNVAKTEIISADSNVILSLNTQVDSQGMDEYTLLAKNDSIYLVNHTSNEIRLLNHFTNEVCEIIPAQKVIDTTNDLTGERELTVVHEEFVYVMTAEPGPVNNACTSSSTKRFYELPLDYQSEPSLNEEIELASLNVVPESQARATLIFGWVDDANNAGQERMVYGYLGYNNEAKSLSLFDKDKVALWTQPRNLQEFDVVDIGQGKKSAKYLFEIHPLENEFYLIQLGLDVFVVDSGLELFSKTQNDIETILTDKIVTLTVNTEDDKRYALPVVSNHDSENLFIIDHAKLYRLPYAENVPVRNPTVVTQVINQRPSFNGQDALGDSFKSQYFSQFDLKECAEDDSDCIAAHNVAAQEWQFFTPCESEYGCTMTIEENDFCDTLEEQQQTQNYDNSCTPTDYRHLAELNSSTNDAQLLAYMQYAENYIRHIDFKVYNQQLFVIAKMDHKDVLLAYDFTMDFSQPKVLRERVLIGKRASLVGMVAHLENDNFFLTALKEGSVRSNECYKNGQKVACNLGDFISTSSATICSGSDLSEGLCVDQFKEYESKAFFCSVNALLDSSCSDANLAQFNDLAVENEDEDAKWLALYDYRETSQKMYLLVGDHTLALETGNLDEGKLYKPSLYEVDQLTGVRSDLLAAMEGTVESLSNTWISKNPEQGMAEVFGHINFVSQEIQQTGGLEIINKSQLTTYLLEQTFEDQSSLTPSVIKAPKVAERLILLD